MPEPTEWTVLAHLLRPQGRKGEILADLFTDFPERFGSAGVARRVFLAPENFTGPESEARPIEVVNHWLPVGKNHGRIVLHFKGIDSINDAELLNGKDILVLATERVELEDDAEYISDLIDCAVFHLDRRVGIVTAVDFPTTPDGTHRLAGAAPLLTVETDEGHEILIPYVQAFLVDLSIENKQIKMNLPEGLIDLNLPTPPD